VMAAVNGFAAGHERSFLDLSTVGGDELRTMLDLAVDMKQALKRDGRPMARPLEGRTLAMIFDKPSTRTRISFHVGMNQLGGEAIYLSGTEMQLGRSETIADTARVVSRYVDAIMMRTTDHGRLLEMAQYATVPVINGLTDDTHPCQILTDIMTFEEKRGPIAGKRVAWSGDGNNVLHSWIEGAARFGFTLAFATPPGSEPEQRYVDWARAAGAVIEPGHDPLAAVAGADCVMTDTWVSMNQEHRARGHNVFLPYQVNAELMKAAKPDAIFMHDLPAHRGAEVTDEVMDGPQSVVFDEAENRLHAQKGILAWCFGLTG
jgi:ornithine carbamoyltransferase